MNNFKYSIIISFRNNTNVIVYKVDCNESI